MNPHKIHSYQPASGLFSDTSKINQPQGTYTYALNAIAETNDGDLGFISNERGNLVKVIFPTGYSQVGHINLLDEETVVLLASDVKSIIGIVDKNYNFTILIESSCLKFDKCKYIKGKYRLINGCERVIYIVDGVNTDKAINIDKLSNYLPLGQDSTYANTNDSWDCSLFKLTPDYDTPCINLNVKYTGGSLDLGVYQVAVEYSDLDGNVSNTVAISNIIPITNYSAGYDYTEGGDPTIVGKVSSSIDIDITNLDLDFPYVNIIVIKTVSNITSAFKVAQLNVSSNVRYTFRGFDDNATAVTLSSLAIDNIVYDTSKSIEIFDNRLFRANLTEKSINWASFQRAANEIETYYFTSANLHGNLDGFDGYKNPSATFKKKSYLRDEIYALGIVWVFKDGIKSPVFHIPGREMNRYPNGTLIPYNIDPMYGHTRFPKTGLNLQFDSILVNSSNVPAEDLTFNPAATKRWEVYNTAIAENRIFPTYGPSLTLDGIPGYHESTLEYPNILDCKNQRIYPPGKIRHHRMPDTTLESHFDTTNDGEFIKELGLKFKNIQVPIDYIDKVQGYYIVRAERTESNRTVLDKGLIYNNVELYYDYDDSGNKEIETKELTITNGVTGEVDTNIYNHPKGSSKFLHQPLGANNHIKEMYHLPTADILPKEAFIENANDVFGQNAFSHSNFSFLGAKAKFGIGTIGADYLKIETCLRGEIENFGRVKEGEDPAAAAGLKFRMRSHEFVNYNFNLGSFLNNNGINLQTYNTNRLIDTELNVTPHISKNIGSDRFINHSQQDTYIITVDNYIPHVNRAELFSDTVLNVGSNDSSDETLNYANTSTAIYGSLKRLNTSIYNNVDNINYIMASGCMHPPGLSEVEIFGGDTFISKLTFKKSFSTVSRLYDKRDSLFVQLIEYFVESDINTELRNSLSLDDVVSANETSQTSYYPKQEKVIFLRDSDLNQFGEGEWNDDNLAAVIDGFHKNEFAKNFYKYNLDYSKENTLKHYFPLQLSFDYCSDCNNQFPNRVIFSQQGFSEQTVDNYRNFLSNNYGELDGTNGPITNIWKFNDIFYIHTEQGLYQQQVKPYQLQTSTGESVYVGVGDALDIPPKEMNSLDTGFAGNEFKEALSINDSGAFFPDSRNGKVYQITEGLKEISNIGERNWFKENLPVKFLNQYKKLTGEEYTCKGTTSNLSVGLSSVYDNRHKRWILFKRDFIILDEDNFNKDNIDFTNSNMFENISWTKSFDAISNSWKSYHSYLPNYMYNNQYKLFSSLDGGNTLWEHNKGEYHNFYGVKYPFIFEYINNESNVLTKTFNSTHFISNVYREDLVNKQFIDIKNETFNNVVFYNDYQCSGLLDVKIKDNTTPYGNISYDSSEIFLNRNERDWSFSNIRDMSILVIPDESLFTSNWMDTNYQNNYPIDKVVNSNKINFLKRQYESQKLRDKYLATRLFYNNNYNHKMVINYIFNKSKSSSR